MFFLHNVYNLPFVEFVCEIPFGMSSPEAARAGEAASERHVLWLGASGTVQQASSERLRAVD